MLVVTIADPPHVELAVESLFRWKCRLFELFPAVNVLVWIDAFPSHEVKVLIVSIKPAEILTPIIIQVACQFV